MSKVEVIVDHPASAMSHAEAIASPLALGAIFQGRYQIIRCIKAGGMGAVYEVLHIETKRRRALKVMLPSLVADPDLRARFRLEATITADVETEHIVETFDAGVEPESGAPFLVMELLKGHDVAEILEQRGPLPADEVVTLLFQLAVALDKTHAVGIVHRDLKPENLFVTRRDDGSPRLKVLDFGIAKMVARSTHAKATARVGTPLYMAPEQLKGDTAIGPSADLYAMGHLAYAMLTARPYWEEESLSPNGIYPLLIKVAEGTLEAASKRASRVGVHIDEGFDAWFAKATAVRPDDRFATASELVATLAESVGVIVTRNPTPVATSTPPRGAPSHPSGGGSIRRPSPVANASTQLGATTPTATQTAIEAPSPASRRSPRSAAIAVALGGALLALGIGTALWVRGRAEVPPAATAPTEAVDTAAPTVTPAPTTEEIVPSALPTTSSPPEIAPSRGSAARPSPPPAGRPKRPPTSAPATTPAEPGDPTRVR